jgi:CHAT domain-containing protein/tetratricopeptide (TPR) repeat protein
MRLVPALAVLLLPQEPQALPDLPRLVVDRPLEGEIVDGLSPVETPTLQEDYADVPVVGRTFLLEAPEHEPFTIELRSFFFDAYLVVRDRAGELLAEDDDGLLRTHARVTLAGRSKGEPLRVEACALHGGRGSFMLVARIGVPHELDRVARADAIAADVAQRIAAVRGKYGEESIEAAHACIRGASELHDLGRWSDAQPLLEWSAALLEKLCGPDHPDTLSSLNNLAGVLADEGLYAEARPLYERVLAAKERRFGPEVQEVTPALNNLAWLADLQGEPAVARLLYERALAIRERALGPSDPLTANSLGNLASVLDTLGEYASARGLYERSLAIYEAKDPGAPEVARVLGNLALTLEHEGRFVDALQSLRRAVEIAENVYGPDSPETALHLGNLGSVCHTVGAFTEARRLYERALSIEEAALGSTHVRLVPNLNNLALLLMETGDDSAAEPICRRALRIAESGLGPEHLDTATCLGTLAGLLDDQGNSAEAQPLYERALAIREKVLGPDHPDTALSLGNLASLIEEEDELEHARRLYERVLAIDERAFGPGHANTATDLFNLAWCHSREGDLSSARRLYERALSIREKALGAAHASTASVLDALACVLADQGNAIDARPMLERALAIDHEVYGPLHSQTQDARRHLSTVCLELGEPDRAFEHAAAAFEVTKALVRSAAPLADWERFQKAAADQDCVDALVDAARAASDRRKEAAAYDAVVCWKGSVRSRLLESRQRMLASLDPETRRDVGELRGVEARLSEEIGRRVEVGEAAAHEAALALLRERRGELDRDLARRLAPDPRGAEATAASLAAMLPPRSALIDLLVHAPYVPAKRQDGRVVKEGGWQADVVTAWIVGAGATEATRVDLGDAASLRRVVTDYVDSIRGASAPTPTEADRDPFARAAGRALRDRLWAPLAPCVASAELLFISPDRFLESLPFETIPLADGSFLVADRSFVYVSSASALARMLRQPRSALDRAEGATLVVGGVDYDAREGDAPLAAFAAPPGPARSGGRPWEPLRFAAREAEIVASLRKDAVDVVRGSAATEESLKQLLPGRRYLHFATHAYSEAEGPLWSPEGRRARGRDEHGLRKIGESERLASLMPGLLTGLVCAGANRAPERGRENGLLTAEEITWLDLSGCDLAVLSACETGLGKDRGGEGMSSLRASFELAGARRVIATLWTVNDKSTCELMGDFYRRFWLGGEPVGAALRHAQLESIARGRPPSAWGAFTLSGDWR